MYIYSVNQIIFSDIITNILMMLFFSRLVNTRYCKIRYTIFAIFIGLIGWFFVDIAESVTLLVFSIYYVYQRKCWYSFETLAFIFVLCCDTLLANLSTFLVHLIFEQTSWASMFLTIAINACLYLVLMLSVPFVSDKLTNFKTSNLNDQRLLKIVINFALVIFLSLQLIQFVADIFDIAVVFQWLLILFTSFFIIATIIVMFYFIRSYQIILKKRAEEKEKQTLAAYTEKLETNYTHLRKFKHDYQNILLSLSEYIKQSNQPDLKSYYAQIVDQTQQILETDNLRFDGLEYIKIPALRSLTYQKLVIARQCGIKTYLEARTDITETPINIVKLIRVLGILFDNAIEETQQQENGSIRIAYIKYNATELEIIIQNTVATGSNVVINKIFNDGYTTKGNGHGTGLSTVKKIIDNTPNMTLETKMLAGQYRIIIDLIKE